MIDKYNANVHARRYIEEVFAERLRSEGFVCADNNSFCWYRIVNEKIVNSIIFCSTWVNLPLMLSMGYGIHTTGFYMHDKRLFAGGNI